MVFLQKISLWVLLLPLTLLGYTFMSAWQFVVFLFNAPMDIWVMISSAVEEATEP